MHIGFRRVAASVAAKVGCIRHGTRRHREAAKDEITSGWRAAIAGAARRCREQWHRHGRHNKRVGAALCAIVEQDVRLVATELNPFLASVIADFLLLPWQLIRILVLVHIALVSEQVRDTIGASRKRTVQRRPRGLVTRLFPGRRRSCRETFRNVYKIWQLISQKLYFIKITMSANKLKLS